MENLDELLNSALSEISWSSEETQAAPEEPINEEPVEESQNLIKENPIIISNNGIRFSAADWYEEATKQEIIIGGVGGIGSWLSLLVSRLYPRDLYLFDPDIVDRTNMSGQLYGSQYVDTPKVSAMQRTLVEFSQYFRVHSMAARYSRFSFGSKIMMGGFDNMEARKVFFESWRSFVKTSSEPRAESLFIDGRLAAEEFQIFAIRGDDDYHMDLYQKDFLFDDSEAEQTVCSYKQTSHCAAMIASVMVNIFVNHIANLTDCGIERPVPFFTSYDCIRMFFKTNEML